MMIIKIRLSVAVGISIALLAVLVLGSIALAEKVNSQAVLADDTLASNDTDSLVVPGGPGFVSLGAKAFAPNFFANYSCYSLYGELIDFYWDDYSMCDYNSLPTATAQLPHGSTIKKFIVYYIDDAEEGMTGVKAMLVRVPFASFDGSVIAEIQSTEDDEFFHYAEDTTIEYPLVDLQLYSYYVKIQLGRYAYFSGVRIDYDYPTLLPLVNK